MDVKAKRHRPQFTLRSMLIVVTLVCVGFGWWVHSSREWIRQRQAMIQDEALIFPDESPDDEPVMAPGGLWLFGEKGVGCVVRMEEAAFSRDELEQVFPEAHVWNHKAWADEMSGD